MLHADDLMRAAGVVAGSGRAVIMIFPHARWAMRWALARRWDGAGTALFIPRQLICG